MNKTHERNRQSKEVNDMNEIGKTVVAVLAASCLAAAACDEACATAGREIRELIETLEVGEPVYYENLTIIPVYGNRIKDRSRYTTLDEALDEGWLEITEVDGGRVPQVRMHNLSQKHIFIMGGEILTGCRQDRIVGRDVLLGPGAKNVIVPVYCVEQGRWTYESDTFYSKRNLGTSRLRAEGQKAGGDAQTKIWSYVSGTTRRAGASSPTSRFQEAYETDDAQRKISGARKKMEHIPRLCPDAIGVVIGIGGRITSADIFANPRVFRRQWPKLLRSSALAAFCAGAGGSLLEADAIDFLRRIHDKAYTRKPAVGLGFELLAVDHEVNVNALVYRDAVIHMAGFPEEETCRTRSVPQDSDRRIRVMRR
jgi:hypothetical protein